VDVVSDAWPMAEIDGIARLRALAAALPGTVVQERLIDAPFDDVWGFVTDLERSVPEFDRDVSRIRIVRASASGERLRIHSWSPGVPIPLPFDVTLRPGWCWMVSDPELYVVGMAAVPEGERTRFGHLEGLVGRLLRPVLPLSRWRHHRHVARDLDGIERGSLARRRSGDEG
jgi:hypothetical protein